MGAFTANVCWRYHVGLALILCTFGLSHAGEQPFQPFAGVQPWDAGSNIGGWDADAHDMIKCSANKRMKRLRDGFESEFRPRFGWVEVVAGDERGPSAGGNAGDEPSSRPGDAWAVSVAVSQEKCLWLQAVSESGESFDSGCMQRAFFSAFLTPAPGAAHCSDAFGWPGPACPSSLPNISVVADVAYHSNSSFHRICFTVPLPGTFQLSVYVHYTNAFVHWFPCTRAFPWLPRGKDGHRMCMGDQYGDGSVGARLVLTRRVRVVPTASGEEHSRGWGWGISQGQERPKDKGQAQLPICTLRKLNQLKGRGYWKGHVEWHPLGCRVKRVSPRQALTCLTKWKEVLLVGDEQMASLMVVLLAYLRAPSREAFLQTLSKPLAWALCQAPSIFRHCRGMAGQAPLAQAYNLLHGKANDSEWKARYRLQMPGTPGSADSAGYAGGAPVTFRARGCKGFLRTTLGKKMDGAFNLTFVSHVGGFNRMLPDWIMQAIAKEAHRSSGKAARPPFGTVLVGSMMSEATELTYMDFPMQLLPTHIVPQARWLAGGEAADERQFVVLGPWGPQAGNGATGGPIDKGNGGTLPRYSFFETAGGLGLRLHGYEAVLLPTLHMSARPPPPAPAKPTNGQAWAIAPSSCATAFATLELWLSNLCP